jgi:carboxyl-terminal processing protease
LRKHRPEIETILRSEIASRYYYQKGKIVAALKHDQELEKAVELILNTDRYKEIFTK